MLRSVVHVWIIARLSAADLNSISIHGLPSPESHLASLHYHLVHSPDRKIDTKVVDPSNSAEILVHLIQLLVRACRGHINAVKLALEIVEEDAKFQGLADDYSALAV